MNSEAYRPTRPTPVYTTYSCANSGRGKGTRRRRCRASRRPACGVGDPVGDDDPLAAGRTGRRLRVTPPPGSRNLAGTVCRDAYDWYVTIVLDLDRHEQSVRLRADGFESCVVSAPGFPSGLRLARHYRRPWPTRAGGFVDELLAASLSRRDRG